MSTNIPFKRAFLKKLTVKGAPNGAPILAHGVKIAEIHNDLNSNATIDFQMLIKTLFVRECYLHDVNLIHKNFCERFGSLYSNDSHYLNILSSLSQQPGDIMIMIINDIPMFADPNFSKIMDGDKFTGLNCARIDTLCIGAVGDISFDLEY